MTADSRMQRRDDKGANASESRSMYRCRPTYLDLSRPALIVL